MEGRGESLFLVSLTLSTGGLWELVEAGGWAGRDFPFLCGGLAGSSWGRRRLPGGPSRVGAQAAGHAACPTSLLDSLWGGVLLAWVGLEGSQWFGLFQRATHLEGDSTGGLLCRYR